VRLRRGALLRVRYVAQSALEVRTGQVAALGALFDAASAAGADDVEGASFSFADPSSGAVEATRAALADARRRAEDAAAQTGQRITGVQSVDLDPPAAVPLGSDESGSSGGGAQRDEVTAETTVIPPRHDFSARVRVVYTIAPA